MKTNVSGLNDAKFHVKTRIHSMLCIFVETGFLVAYGGRLFSDSVFVTRRLTL